MARTGPVYLIITDLIDLLFVPDSVSASPRSEAQR